MTELVSYNSERIYWAVEQVEQEAGDIEDLHLDDSLFYIKADTDKVIAEKDAVIAKLKAKLEGAKNETNYWCNNLKVFAQKKDAEIAELKADYQEACDRLQTANLIKDEQLAATRHHKYKRCLAMASYWLAVSYQCVDDKHRQSAARHRHKWLELANKFEEDE